MESMEDSVVNEERSSQAESQMDSSTTSSPDEDAKPKSDTDTNKTLDMGEEDVKPKINIKKEEKMEEDAEEEADNLENSENEPEKSEDNRREKKPRIDIKVSAQDGNEVCFKVSRNVRMQKLMNTFAETIKADVTSLRFMLGSKRVRGDDTPTTLEIDEDNNEIQVHFPLHGG